SWVSLPPLNINANTVTITMWIYPTRSPNQVGSTGLFMSRNRPAGDVCGLGFGGSGTSLGYTWNTNNAATFNFVSGLVVPTNQWSFVALAVDPTNATLYLFNTNFVGSTNNPIPHGLETFAGTTWIGDDQNGTNRTFQGSIDE